MAGGQRAHNPVKPQQESRSDIALPARLLIGACLTTMLSGAVQAAENQRPLNGALPDLELLEFLGSFSTDEGEWIAPDSLLENEFSALLDAAGTTNDNPASGQADSDDGSTTDFRNNATQDSNND